MGKSIVSTFISGERSAYLSLTTIFVFKYFCFAHLSSNNWFEWTQFQNPRKKKRAETKLFKHIQLLQQGCITLIGNTQHLPSILFTSVMNFAASPKQSHQSSRAYADTINNTAQGKVNFLYIKVQWGHADLYSMWLSHTFTSRSSTFYELLAAGSEKYRTNLQEKYCNPCISL